MIQVTMQEWTVLTFIKTYKQKHGYSPSALDIASGCAMTTRHSARRLLKRLERAGVLRLGCFRQSRIVTLRDVRVGVTP